jgi:hypothetical protein
MPQPLTNDFGVPISREMARRTLEAAGWHQSVNDQFWYEPSRGSREPFPTKPHTLQQAWEEHKSKWGPS